MASVRFMTLYFSLRGLMSLLISRPGLLESLVSLWPFIWDFKTATHTEVVQVSYYRSPLQSRGSCMIDKVLCSVVYLNRVTSGHAGPHFTFCHLNVGSGWMIISLHWYAFFCFLCMCKDTNYRSAEANESTKSNWDLRQQCFIKAMWQI